MKSQVPWDQVKLTGGSEAELTQRGYKCYKLECGFGSPMTSSGGLSGFLSPPKGPYKGLAADGRSGLPRASGSQSWLSFDSEDFTHFYSFVKKGPSKCFMKPTQENINGSNFAFEEAETPSQQSMEMFAHRRLLQRYSQQLSHNGGDGENGFRTP
ncbi:hypothetical protein STEG23_000014 [Scotinomys teguina]